MAGDDQTDQLIAVLERGGEFVNLLEACGGDSEKAVETVLRWSDLRDGDKLRGAEGDDSCINKMLPQEMLEKVFRCLPPRDLKTVMLVCKQWNSAASSPKLWSWVTFTFEYAPFRTFCLRRTMGLRRLNGARGIAILRQPLPRESSHKSWSELLQGVLHHPGIKHLRLDANIAEVDPNLLAQVFARMQKVEIGLRAMKTMTCPQKGSLYDALKRPNQLKKLALGHHQKNFLALEAAEDPSLLVTALNRITRLQVGLTEVQANLLLWETMQDGSSLKGLSLTRRLQLAQFEATPFFAAFGKLEELHLDGSHPAAPQHLVLSLCQTVAAGTRLKKLRLINMDLSEVDHQLLSRMAAHVEEFTLESMTRTQLRREQAGAILGAAGKLKKLEMEMVSCLSEVDAEVLALGANRLEWFKASHVTMHQVDEILTRALTTTSLEGLCLKGPSGGEDISLDLISRAKQIITFVDIGVTEDSL